MTHPQILQGGMGAAVSSWPLARAAALEGFLGVVSGTALDVVLARRLQDGDVGGHLRRALAHFPVAEASERILARYFLANGRGHRPYRPVPRFRVPIPRGLQELVTVANFVEVWLAKEGHDGWVGINYLEKIQMPNLPSLYGAMLAGVDYVLMGAGIPREIPRALELLSAHAPAWLTLQVDGALPDEAWHVSFDPREVVPQDLPALQRPRFLAIVSSNVLATTMARKVSPPVDGFVVEGPGAGGHNAPPRGAMQLDAEGQPIYGERDLVDLPRLAELGLPFWLAGGYGSAPRLQEALSLGAAGVQIGTAFALCRESGLADRYRHALRALAVSGAARVYTDPLASPTGFPFKVAPLPGTLSDDAVFQRRERVCDLGFLRRVYRREDGRLGYRCSSEPLAEYLRKGGSVEDTAGRKCLCNALLANVGLAQVRASGDEPALLTVGNHLETVGPLVAQADDLGMADVARSLRGD